MMPLEPSKTEELVQETLAALHILTALPNGDESIRRLAQVARAFVTRRKAAAAIEQQLLEEELAPEKVAMLHEALSFLRPEQLRFRMHPVPRGVHARRQ